MLATSFQLPDYNPIVSHCVRHAMWLVCFDILKIVNWKCTVSLEIHNNSSLTFKWEQILEARSHIMMTSQHNSVLHAFSVPDWSEMCGVVDVLTVFYYRPPGKFRYTAGEILKMCCQEFDIYIDICIYIYITLSMIEMIFYISSTWDYIIFEGFFNVEKRKCFSKVGRSVVNWRSG